MTLPPAFSRALAFDPAGFRPAAAARAAIGVALPLVVGAATGHPADGAMAAAGALPVGVAAASTTLPTTPVGLLVTTSLGMSVSTFVGSLVAGHEPAVVAASAVWGFFGGLMVALGREATITGVQAVVGLLVFGRYPGGVGTSALHAGAVFAGGLLQTSLALLLRPPLHRRAERVALAAVYSRLAELASGSSYGGPSGEAIADASALVTRRARDDPTLRGLVDEARRIRLELQSLTAAADVDGVRRVAVEAEHVLRAIAQSIAAGRPPEPTPPELVAAAETVRGLSTTPGRAGTRRRFAAARAAALLGQLRAADRLAAALAGERRLALPHVAGFVPTMQLAGAIRGNLTRLRHVAVDRQAPALRHALRLAVLLPLADVISLGLPWRRGYWVPVTVIVVLKPDYAATIQRGLARIIGTGMGVVLAGLLVATARPTGAGLVAVVTVLAWTSYALFAASYAVFSFALTALVVLLVSTGDPKPLAAVADRGLDTAVGGALALLAFAVWPTREEATLRASTSRLLIALADYADVVLDGYVTGSHNGDGRLEPAARAARRARAEAQASLDRALAEPRRLRPDVELPMSVLSSARRTVIALHSLRATLQDSDVQLALPEVSSMRAEVRASLEQLATSVTTGSSPHLPLLREGQHQLEQLADEAPETMRGRRLAVVAAHLDPLVDAIDTIGHVLTER